MASREILSLDTATPQIVAPQTGDTYSAPRAVAISPESLTGSAATTSLDIAQTWNTTGTPTAVKLNVTDTTSNAASKLMDLQVGGVSQFNVNKAGVVVVSSITFGTSLTTMQRDSGQNIGFGLNGNNTSTIGANGVSIASGVNYSFSSTNDAMSGIDLALTRDAAQTLAQRNATNAQTLRVYNTYTSLTNRENIRIAAASNVFYIEPEKGSGGGTIRPLVVGHGATTYSALPAASAALEGARAYVSDWTGAATFGTTVNAGGGTTKVPVWCDGTNWLVG